jgi:glutamyl-tRNA reductase
LVRVASSLDSLVVGEAQILGQLKQGFETGLQSSTVGSTLHQLFARAARGAKRIRSETSIGVGQVSVPSIAVELAQQIFGDMGGRRAVLIGAGEMGQTVARLLRDLGAELTVVGRDAAKLDLVCAKVDGKPALMDALAEVLLDADVVVSSTSASHHVVTKAHLLARKKARRGNLFLIDLAVPRDVEPIVGKMQGVFLYDVDDLSQVASESATVRQRGAEDAERIVDEVVGDWERRQNAQAVTPTIKALRAKMRRGLEAELSRSLRGRLRELDEGQRAALAKMLDAGINRILHEPVTRLRDEASREDGLEVSDLTLLLAELFDLKTVPEADLDVSGVRLPSGDPGEVSYLREESSPSNDDIPKAASGKTPGG